MPAPSGFSATPPPRPRRRWAHWIIATIVIGLILFFIGQVGYFMWQFRYGDSQQVAKIQAEFRSNEWSGNKNGEGPKPPTALEPYIKAYNPTLGKATAPVTIVAFIDFECPFCRRSQPIFDQMLEKYGPAVRVVYKALPLASLHPNAFAAAEAAACAQDQGKFWEYYQLLFKNQALDDAGLTAAAQALTLDQAKFTHCLQTHPHQATIEADIDDAIALGVRGTPTYFVKHAVIEGVADAARWDQVIISQLR